MVTVMDIGMDKDLDMYCIRTGTTDTDTDMNTNMDIYTWTGISDRRKQMAKELVLVS
jgi:hypothetical protein